MDLGICYIEDELSFLSAELLSLAQERKLEVITIESCTGGLLSSVLTDVEGLSHVFNCALVTYCDQSKTKLANVPHNLIAEHGAVSAVVAQAMACGGRNLIDKDCLALAITGYAGTSPDGGTPGLVYIAVSAPNAAEYRRCDFSSSARNVIRSAAVKEALLLGLCVLKDGGRSTTINL